VFFHLLFSYQSSYSVLCQLNFFKLDFIFNVLSAQLFQLIRKMQQEKVRPIMLYILLNTAYDEEMSVLLEWCQMIRAEHIHEAYEDVVI